MLRRVASVLMFATVFGIWLSGSTMAQTNEPMIELPDHVSPAVGNLEPSVPAAPDMILNMEIVFSIQNKAAFDKYVADQANPESPDYRHFLSGREFVQRYGPTAAQFQAVADWLTSQGFQITSGSQLDRFIKFTGTVRQAENAFGVTIIASRDGRQWANTGNPHIPARFRGVFGYVGGLHNLGAAQPAISFPRPKPGHGSLRLREEPERYAYASGDTIPDFAGGGLGQAFGVSDMRTFYSETPLLNAGIDGGKVGGSTTDCVAIIAESDFSTSPIKTFDATFNLADPSITEVFVDSPPAGQNSTQDETLLDIEWAHATAPGAPIFVYVGNPTLTGNMGLQWLVDALNTAVSTTDPNGNKCGAISISFETCGEPNSFYQQMIDGPLSQAQVNGQSAFVSSGDFGAAAVFRNPDGGCSPGTVAGVNELAADPNVAAVGGTMFTPHYDSNNNDIGFVTEQVWNDASGSSGGGASIAFTKPSYQTGTGVPADGQRDVPDIALAAGPNGDPGYYFVNSQNALAILGGTSFGAPIWAGVSKLIAQKNGGRVGNINQKLYALGGLGGVAGLRDVTSGKNSFNNVTGFSAGVGYDQATGWGTLDIGMFVNQFVVTKALVTGFSAASELYDPSFGAFSTTGSTKLPLQSFTQTLLDSGKALVAGGDSNGTTATAELYDPATGAFTYTGSMAKTRDDHAASLLNNGEVLVSGGDVAGTTTTRSSAELYDPTTGKFSTAASMNAARALHTMTLLGNGKVLVAAGENLKTGFLRSAELFDPNGGSFGVGSFALTGKLATARSGHSATLLPDGTVLVTGGSNSAQF
jgi:subtilase family serine protease